MNPAAIGSMGGLDMGGGSIDAGASSSNRGGNNQVGGTVFGNYNPAASSAASQAWVPWAVVGAVALGALFIFKGAK